MVPTLVALFQDHPIRKVLREGKWFFSVVDVVRVLSGSPDHQTARKYWNQLAKRLRNEGSESVTKCHRLKLEAADGKSYLSDCADLETTLRIIQSVPSPKAEPLKLWLAQVGRERVEELADPSTGLDRVRATWQAQGRDDRWIQRRMMGQETRNKLTDYWKESGVKEGLEYAVLTDIIHQGWSDLATAQHKELKSLKKTRNLRDHMTEAELVLTALAELSTRQIAESVEARGFVENQEPARAGGKIAKGARVALEARTGKGVVTGENFLADAPAAKRLGKGKKKTGKRT